MRSLLLALCLSLSLAAPARAAPKSPESKRAAELAVRAVKLYRGGQFKEAATTFLEAYAISKRPAQLRNAAKAYEEGGFLDESISLWKSYRDHPAISPDEKAEAEAHVKLVEEKTRNQVIVRQAEAARIAAEAARADAEKAKIAATSAVRERNAAPSATQAVTAPPPPERSYAGPVALLVSGGVGLAAGTVLWIVQGSKLGSLDEQIATVDPEGRIVGTSPDEVRSTVSSVNTLRGLSGSLLALGAVAAVSGAVWLAVDGDKSSEARDEPRRRDFDDFSVMPLPDGAIVSASGRW